MAHLAVASGYHRLVERLNRHPQGAPPSDLLYRILEILFSPREAELVARLPIRPFGVKTASRAWGLPLAQTQAVLERLASRAILLDIERNGEQLYVLPPPMAGFFEFSMMRVRGDIDQKALSELLYEYINVEGDFIRELFLCGGIQLGRAFVQESSLPPALALQVFDYERASQVARNADVIGVGLCYCRHKRQHLGRACEAPLSICLTFGNAARSLAQHGFARAIDAAECLDLLQEAQGRSLVQFGDNVRERVSFICNCCRCCCEAMVAAREFALLHPVHTTNFIAALDAAGCNGCGRCARACPVDAIEMRDREDPASPYRKVAAHDPERCLGCGVCVRACAQGLLRMQARKERVLTPLNKAHRAVLMAIERGKLQDLVFDNRAHLSHRVMAAILGVILRLAPVKQALASRQLRSRYLEALLRNR
jgi:formate hydrogenlyase subunit 6/NADH:ubiquinone oxidoreductase subunit I